VFEAGASKLPEDSRDQLKSLVESMSEKTSLRLQLLAYAGGESLSSSKARRLSLSRALSVRSYLIESGLRSTRIDVRALGNKTTDEPVNRVDINVIER
jgi:outer membrane protein OmpA-like peptidoglycan-associated protein